MVTRALLCEEVEDSLSSLLLMIAISRSSWLIMAMWSVIDQLLTTFELGNIINNKLDLITKYIQIIRCTNLPIVKRRRRVNTRRARVNKVNRVPTNFTD